MQPGLSGEVPILSERSRKQETLSKLSTSGGDYLPQKSLKGQVLKMLSTKIALLSFNFLQGCGNDIYIYQVLKSIWRLPIFKFLKTVSKYLFYFSIPLCILGLYRCLVDKNSALKGLAVVLIFYFVFFHLFVPLPKYMIPFRPIIYLFAMMYVSTLWDKLHEKKYYNYR